MRRFILLLSAVGLFAALLAPAASAATPYCGITWGSLTKSDPDTFAPGPLLGVRVGRHACFDRLVIDLRGPEPGYTVQYVPQVGGDGEAPPLSLRGGAFLEVTVNAANVLEGPGWRYDQEIATVSGFSTFREVASAGGFEHHHFIGLGVRARLPFRVFTLPGPGDGSRLVIDVAHRW
jgi:hypothetical protein